MTLNNYNEEEVEFLKVKDTTNDKITEYITFINNHSSELSCFGHLDVY